MQWWFNQKEDGRWSGPEDTREAAIQAGRNDFGGEQFMVMQAETGDLDLNPGGYRVLDWLDDTNCDVTDPDGDGFAAAVPKDAEDDLGDVIEAAIKAWAVKHNINTRAFRFTKTTVPEVIPALSEANT